MAKKKPWSKKVKDRIWLAAMAVMMLLGFFVFGPLIDTQLISKQKPYILVTESNMKEVNVAKASKAACYVPPYTPYEVDSNYIDGEKVYRLPIDRMRTEWLPYVHYPASWNKWYNMFNPEQPLGPILRRVLMILNPLLFIGLVVYAIVLWRQGKFKNLFDKVKGKEDK